MLQLDPCIPNQHHLREQSECVRIRLQIGPAPVVVVVADSEAQKAIVGGRAVVAETVGHWPVEWGVVGWERVVVVWGFPEY